MAQRGERNNDQYNGLFVALGNALRSDQLLCFDKKLQAELLANQCFLCPIYGPFFLSPNLQALPLYISTTGPSTFSVCTTSFDKRAPVQWYICSKQRACATGQDKKLYHYFHSLNYLRTDFTVQLNSFIPTKPQQT